MRFLFVCLVALANVVGLFASEQDSVKVSCEKGKIFVELPQSYIGKELIYSSVVVDATDMDETNIGFRPCPLEVLEFSVIDSSLVLSKSNSAIIYTSKLEKGSSASVYKADYTSFFIKDRNYFRPKDLKAYNGMGGFVVRDYSFNGGASLFSSASSFENGFSVETELSYYITRSLFAMTDLVTDKPFTTTIKNTFYLSHSNDEFKSQPYDSSIGTGYVSKDDFGTQGYKTLKFATKWRKPAAKEAIVEFYVDSLMPAILFEALSAAANMWNDGFSDQGLPKAVELKINDGTEYRPATIRYSTSMTDEVRTSVVPDLNTGEILAADIFIGGTYYARMVNELELRCAKIYPSQIANRELDSIILPILSSNMALYMGEVLGFVRNNAASYDIPVDSLRSKTFTNSHGISNSVMDDLLFNIVASADDINNEVKLVQTELGPYDLAAISSLYGDGSRYSDSKYMFGNKQSSKGYSDPRAVSWDMGDDNIKSTSYVVDNIYDVLDTVSVIMDNFDKDYQYRMEFTDFVVTKLFRYANPVLQNIGGVYLYDNEGKEIPKYALVPAEIQKQSLEWIFDNMEKLSAVDTPNFIKYADLNSNISDFIIKEMFSITLNKVLKITQNTESNFTKTDALTIFAYFLWDKESKFKPVLLKKMQKDFVEKLKSFTESEEYGYLEALMLMELYEKELESVYCK